jgi:DNA-binding response OmpR family regulator
MQRTILVVDDDPMLADVLVELFAEEGYCARHVHDGETALSEIERPPPDLVVSDISIPGIDGVTLTREMRTRGMQVPVVLVSAVIRDVRVPGVTLLPKPFDLEDLLQTVSQIFAGAG